VTQHQTAALDANDPRMVWVRLAQGVAHFLSHAHVGQLASVKLLVLAFAQGKDVTAIAHGF
jgi:hypothetical protein